MENNIFIKMKRDKCNPDVENKFTGKENERDNTKFNLSTLIYNPITGVVPNQIRSNNDLILEKDIPYTNSDTIALIAQKENERLNQDIQFKPLKTRVINNNPQNSLNQVENNHNNEISQVNRTNYIETYEELKKSSGIIGNEQSQNKEKFNGILDGLKDLGIIK